MIMLSSYYAIFCKTHFKFTENIPEALLYGKLTSCILMNKKNQILVQFFMRYSLKILFDYKTIFTSCQKPNLCGWTKYTLLCQNSPNQTKKLCSYVHLSYKFYCEHLSNNRPVIKETNTRVKL